MYHLDIILIILLIIKKVQMIYISHRGNLDGPNPELENSPNYITAALAKGYDVEVDVWWLENSGYWLGHDSPQYEVDKYFLSNKKLWCHAKDIKTISRLIRSEFARPNPFVHCFFHQNDDVTLTSKNFLWTYPGKPLDYGSIAVLPERAEDKWTQNDNFVGICSDYIDLYRKPKRVIGDLWPAFSQTTARIKSMNE